MSSPEAGGAGQSLVDANSAFAIENPIEDQIRKARPFVGHRDQRDMIETTGHSGNDPGSSSGSESDMQVALDLEAFVIVNVAGEGGERSVAEREESPKRRLRLRRSRPLVALGVDCQKENVAVHEMVVVAPASLLPDLCHHVIRIVVVAGHVEKGSRKRFQHRIEDVPLPRQLVTIFRISFDEIADADDELGTKQLQAIDSGLEDAVAISTRQIGNDRKCEMTWVVLELQMTPRVGTVKNLEPRRRSDGNWRRRPGLTADHLERREQAKRPAREPDSTSRPSNDGCCATG